MSESIIYSGIMGSIFASLPSIDTKIVLFDTKIVDVTEAAKNDPVDLLFGVQLGGGTDINKSVSYCKELIENPSKTIFILVSDLYEGGVETKLLQNLAELKESSVKCITLLALSDEGTPVYDKNLGEKISELDIPCFACNPEKLPTLIEKAIKGESLEDINIP
jgi:uncharacterized protein with von Willebrand factor type A (vWA) domain